MGSRPLYKLGSLLAFAFASVGAAHPSVEPSSSSVRNVMFTLTRGDDSALDALVESRKCLLEALEGGADYDHVVFHDGKMAPEALAAAQSLLPDVRFISVADQFVVPDNVHVAALDDGAVGYRLMCSFMALEWHRLLSQYEYAMRVDEDVCLQQVATDPFVDMRARGLVYGYGRQTLERHEPTLRSMPGWVGEYAKAHALPTPADPYALVQNMYFSNYFVSRVDWWSEPAVQRFLSAVQESGNIFAQRWGDAPIQTVALRLLAPPEAVGRLPTEYLHVSTMNKIHLDGTETDAYAEWSALVHPLTHAIHRHLQAIGTICGNGTVNSTNGSVNSTNGTVCAMSSTNATAPPPSLPREPPPPLTSTTAYYTSVQYTSSNCDGAGLVGDAIPGVPTEDNGICTNRGDGLSIGRTYCDFSGAEPHFHSLLYLGQDCTGTAIDVGGPANGRDCTFYTHNSQSAKYTCLQNFARVSYTLYGTLDCTGTAIVPESPLGGFPAAPVPTCGNIANGIQPGDGWCDFSDPTSPRFKANICDENGAISYVLELPADGATCTPSQTNGISYAFRCTDIRTELTSPPAPPVLSVTPPPSPAPPLPPLQPNAVLVRPSDDLVSVLASAPDGGTLLLADGTYAPEADPLNALVISKSVALRAVNEYGVTLDGQGARRVLRIDSGNVTLDGVVVTGGYIGDNGEHGAGIGVRGGVVEMTNVYVWGCKFGLLNRASRGTGLDVADGHVTATDSFFSYNEAPVGTGAGVSVRGGVADFLRCEFKGNEAIYGSGGGIAIANVARVSVIESSVIENSAGAGGAGIDADAGTLVMQHTRVIGNRATLRSVTEAACALIMRRLVDGANSLMYNNTFIPGNCEADVMIYMFLQVPFRCEPGRYMTAAPFSVAATTELVGCQFPCPAGTFGGDNLFLDAQECSGRCPAGHFCPEGTVDPIPCPPGYFLGSESGSSPQSCIPCSPGTFNPHSGRTNDSCITCPAGSLSVDLAATSCGACPAGGFCALEGAASIRQTYEPCKAGTYNPREGSSSSADCIDCPLGTANPIPGSSQPDACLVCLPGSFSNVTGQPMCTLCPAGTYQAGRGATKCDVCPVGAYCPTGSSTPIFCPTGTRQPVEGGRSQADCLGCAPGFWCTSGAAVECLVGFYSAQVNATNETACERCPRDSTTLAPASTSRSQCVCQSGRYNNETTPGSVNCVPCIVGVNCTNASSVRTLAIELGYWRPTPTSIDVRRCPDSTAGCANSDEAGVCRESTSGCLGGTFLQADPGRRLVGAGNDGAAAGPLCRRGLSGAFCRACPDNDDSAPWVYYKPATQTEFAKCDECGTVVGRYFAVWIAILVVLLLVFYLLRLLRQRATLRVLEQAARLYRVSSPHVKIKLLLGFFFIASRVEQVYEVTLPRPVRRAFGVLVTGFSLGLSDDVTVLTCMGIQGFLARLNFWIVSPLVVVMLAVLYALGKLYLYREIGEPWLSGRGLFYSTLPLATRILFFLYPIVTNVAFESFSCYDFDNGDGTTSSSLVVDVRIDCSQRSVSDSVYQRVFSNAWVAIFLYPVGLIVAFGAMLYQARHAIRMGKPSPLSTAIDFLHREFESAFFWWELVEMLRRLVLIGFFILLDRGSITQLIAGTIYCLFHQLIQMLAAPYKSLHDNFLANASNFALCVLFLTLIMFQVSNATGLAEVREVLAPEQRSNLTVDSLALTVVLVFTLLTSVGVGAVLLVFELRRERERIALEARNALARRLRYVDTNEEVLPPPLPKEESVFGHFHLFLSHVWGTGQDQMRVIKQRLKEMMPTVAVFLDVDDLKTGRGQEYVDQSRVVLIFCSAVYFESKNCMRECLRAIHDKKPIVALLEPDSKHGAMSIDQVRDALHEGEAADRYGNWGLQKEMVEWGMTRPTPTQIFDALFAQPPLEWNRITAFQDVTLRALAERILGNPRADTCVQGELAFEKVELPAVSTGNHVHCSPNNPGARELLEELAGSLHIEMERSAVSPSGLSVSVDGADSSGLASTSTNLRKGGRASIAARLMVSEGPAKLASRSTCMLVYLNGLTWTRGASSDAFAQEVKEAMEDGVYLLLAHEMEGIAQEARHSCPFESFFVHTPPELLQRGVYNDIALPLKGAAWRQVSMVMMGKAVRSAVLQAQGGSSPSLRDEQSSSKMPWLRRFRRASRSSFKLTQRVLSKKDVGRQSGRAASKGSLKAIEEPHSPARQAMREAMETGSPLADRGAEVPPSYAAASPVKRSTSGRQMSKGVHIMQVESAASTSSADDPV